MGPPPIIKVSTAAVTELVERNRTTARVTSERCHGTNSRDLELTTIVRLIWEEAMPPNTILLLPSWYVCGISNIKGDANSYEMLVIVSQMVGDIRHQAMAFVYRHEASLFVVLLSFYSQGGRCFPWVPMYGMYLSSHLRFEVPGS